MKIFLCSCGRWYFESEYNKDPKGCVGPNHLAVLILDVSSSVIEKAYLADKQFRPLRW